MHRKFLCLGISLLLTASCFAAPLSASAVSEKGSTELSENVMSIVSANDGFDQLDDYFDYYDKYESKETHYGYIKVDGTDFSDSNNVKVGKVKGINAAKLQGDNAYVEYTVNAPADGKYGISLDYYALPDKEKDIEVTVSVDGKIPYKEAKQILVPRVWEDFINPENVPEGAYFECQDPDGLSDDVRPTQAEKHIWVKRDLINVAGLYTEPYQFWLTAGKHKIRLTLEREAIALGEIRIGNNEKLLTYKDYIAKFTEDEKVKNNGVKFGEDNDLSIVQEGEQTYYKNNIVLYPTYDNSGPSTQPASPAYTKLNTIGSTSWSTNGDEIVWKINVKKAGLYKLALRSRQNYNPGMFSYRTLKVNDEIPFLEAKEIGFKYQQSWYMLTVGGEENPYYIYLNEGENTVSLSCTTADMSPVLRNVQQAVLNLNVIYRQIIAITSADPDIYRDYTLEKQIPTLEKDLKEQQKFIEDTSKIVQKITGTAGSQASSLDYVSKIIGEFAEDPYIIPERLATFKDGIETLGSLVSTLSELAVEIDYLAFLPVDVETPSAGKGFFNAVDFTWKQFISSFTIDYNSQTSGGSDDEDAEVVKVWVSTGRDQAQIINRLISDSADELVTKDGKKIAIQLSMVNTGATLIRATLAGKGPDCALMIGEDTPMNLAARGALVPLSDYKKPLESQFQKSAWIPFWYNGEYYALPETSAFDVMFYRTDIFKQLGINPPNTWDEFYKVLEVLQNSNLIVGIPEVNSANAGISNGITTFDKFLLQNGGTYYNKNLDATLFNSEVSYNAFEKWVDLYAKFSLPRSFDFYSRFRTGEMPFSIQPYTAYNQIKAAAPELNGLWTFSTIPGTVQKDGSINRTEQATVTGCMMLKSVQEKNIEDAAATFLSWWVNADTQAEYARELEATLGLAARYHPANIKTFDTIGWTTDEAKVLKEQWDWTTVMYEVPGNYVLKRSITSAFRNAIAGKNTARRALTIYNKDINDEIKRKRAEFGLD